MKRILTTLALGLLLLGCPLGRKRTVDAGADPNNPPTADPGTAKNEKDIVRDPSKETAIANEAAVVAKDGVEVKNQPLLGGTAIGTLGKSTAVVKISKYFSTSFLITYDDPAGGGKLMGWVAQENLAAPSTTSTATATATWKPIPTAPKVVDAGGAPVAVVDAGAPPVAPTGTTPQPGAAQLFVPLPANGQCPAGFAKAGPGCKRPCANDANCPRNTFCVAKFCSSSK